MKFASRSTLPASLTASRRSPVVRLRAAAAPARARSVAFAAVAHQAACDMAAGKSFGRKRIEHAVEVAGACIMLAMFLMLALFA